eukprot:TRINITY_DN14422_c0_g1_i2.p1 TRINITY_DN14422_c0_g1~~TRINITY_DN14422_c0_g1_i2.p1  ORF type:complete len:176 (+),score=17.86 TRINITY_DN14422_c0_g1_i2:58-528(+)
MPTLLSLNVEEAEENTSWFPDMSWKDRVQGFIACCCLGLLCSILSWFALFGRHMVKYSFLMSIGNLISLASTGFLVGFKRQVTTMFHEKRQVATCVYLLALTGTVVAAVVVHNALIAIILSGVQYCALVWYCLSYIPYGREMFWGCIKSVFGCIMK